MTRITNQTLMLSQQLLDSIPMPIRIIEQSADGTPVFLWFNACALAEAGMGLDAVVGKTAASLLNNSVGDIATERHRKVFLSQQPMTYTQQMPFFSGTRTLQVTLVPLTLEPDNVPIIVATSDDITDQQRNELQWIKAETINQEIKEFTSLVAHDLRTPMRQVSAFAAILKEGFNDMGDGKLQMIDTIGDISERAADLVGDLLKISAGIESSITTVETFELDTVCSDIFTLLDPLRHHNLTRESVLITVDKMVLMIVLRNLIDNAIKHNIPNVVNMHIAVSPCADVEGQLSFTVSDNGKGLGDVLEVFQDNVLDASESGHGLSALKRLLRFTGGSIGADASVDGKGAVFTFVLPGELAQQKDNRQSIVASEKCVPFTLAN